MGTIYGLSKLMYKTCLQIIPGVIQPRVSITLKPLFMAQNTSQKKNIVTLSETAIAKCRDERSIINFIPDQMHDGRR